MTLITVTDEGVATLPQENKQSVRRGGVCSKDGKLSNVFTPKDALLSQSDKVSHSESVDRVKWGISFGLWIADLG
jgi:hypothetical protein